MLVLNNFGIGFCERILFKVIFVSGDITESKTQSDIIESALKNSGQIDVLVIIHLLLCQIKLNSRKDLFH